MFGVGFQEILFILVIALIVFGPKKLPELARWLGRGMAELRKATDDFRSAIELEEFKSGSPERKSKSSYPRLPEGQSAPEIHENLEESGDEPSHTDADTREAPDVSGGSSSPEPGASPGDNK